MSNEVIDAPGTPRRRDLLPKWIKFFVWMFMFFGIMAPIGLIMGLFGMSFDVSLFGMSTSNPWSLTGLFLTSLFVFKGIVAYGLWTEKEWAASLAALDGLISIIICVIYSFVMPTFKEDGETLNFTFELILLVPYFIKMNKLRPLWKSAGQPHSF